MACPRLLPHQFIACNIAISDSLQMIDYFFVALRRKKMRVSSLQFEILIDWHLFANLARCNKFTIYRFKDWKQSASGGKARNLDCVARRRSPAKWAGNQDM